MPLVDHLQRKMDPWLVLKYFLLDRHPIISLPVHHTTTILEWFSIFLIKQSSLFLMHDLLFLKLCYRQFHINNNEGNHLKKYSNNDPEKPC